MSDAGLSAILQPRQQPLPLEPEPVPQFFYSPEEAAVARARMLLQPAPAPEPTPEPAAPPEFFYSPEEAAAARQQLEQQAAPTVPVVPGPEPVAAQHPVAVGEPTVPEEGAHPHLEETGGLSGLFSGAVDLTKNIGSLVTGNAFTDDPNYQPTHRSTVNEIGYGLGYGLGNIPTAIGGALAGAPAGAAVGGAFGGPPGAAIGGTIGGIGGSALALVASTVAGDLRPSYLGARHEHPEWSHEEAVNYAIRHGLTTGIITGLTAPLFAYAPGFAGFVGRALFTSAVTAPAAGTATRLAIPLVTGDPQPSWDELKHGALVDVGTAGAFTFGQAANRARRGGFRSLIEPEHPVRPRDEPARPVEGAPQPPAGPALPAEALSTGKRPPAVPPASEVPPAPPGAERPARPGEVPPKPEEKEKPEGSIGGPLVEVPGAEGGEGGQQQQEGGPVPPPVGRGTPRPHDEPITPPGGTRAPAPAGEGGAERVQPAPQPERPGGVGDQAGRPPGDQGTKPAVAEPPPGVRPEPVKPPEPATPVETAKRPVTKDELDALDKQITQAQRNINNAERPTKGAPASQEELDALRAKRDALIAERDRSEGPPPRVDYAKLGPGKTTAQHQAELDAHQARIDQRTYTEGKLPVPEPQHAGRIFPQANGQMVRGTDAEGNLWIGTGHALVKGGTLERAAYQEGKLKRANERQLPADALGKVVTPDAKADYQKVTWERQVTNPYTGEPVILGTKADGTHIAVAKPVYDAMHAAAGKDGNVYASIKGGDDRVFARTAKGETTGVGMPMRVRPEQAEVWARGTKPATTAAPATPVERPAGGAAAPAPAEPARPVDVTKLAPEELYPEMLRRSQAAQDAEDAVAATQRGSAEEKAAAAASDAADKAHAETRAAYDALPDRQFTVTVREGKTTSEHTHTGKTQQEVYDTQRDALETYNRQTNRKAQIAGIRPAGEAAPPTELASERGLTTEPDDVVPNQFVAKQGEEVVGKGPTPEAAMANAMHRDLFEQQPAREVVPGPAGAEETARAAGPVVPEETGAYVPPGAREPTPRTPEVKKTSEQLRQATQLDKLRATRDMLEVKANRTPGENFKLRDLTQQIEKLERSQPEAVTEAEARRGGVKEPFRGPPVEGLPRDPIDYQFNDGTSVWDDVFKEAGYNPDLAKSFTIQRQNQILTRHMEKKFGFKSVQVVGKKGPTATPVDEKIARDAMMDMTRAMTDAMAAMNLPHEAASLSGKLTLILEPAGSRKYWGQYSLRYNEIRVVGGANSFGHEWTHAWDHLLGERLLNNPTQMADLLTRYTRGGNLDVTKSVDAAFAKLINTMFFDEGSLAARRLALETEAQRTDRNGNPTKAALDAQKQIELIDKGGTQLRGIAPSEFRLKSAQYDPRKAGYWASVYEMFARSHEAYMAWKMEGAGVDPRGVVMPDEAYIAQTHRYLDMVYPKVDDRMRMFAAFDELHDAMLNEHILSGGKPPGGFANLGRSDPYFISKTAPVAGKTALGRAFVQDINRLKNLSKNLAKESLLDANRPSPGYLKLGTRIADGFRLVTHSIHGMMETIIARSPDAAKPIMTKVMDLVAGAPGEGRFTGEHFEQRSRNLSRGFTARYGNIMKAHGLDPDNVTPEQDAMLRHVMVTGENRYPPDPINAPNVTKIIPPNVVKAAGPLRRLMDEMWRLSHDVGLDVGYSSRYFPRLYDMHKFFADTVGFTKAATKLHSVMFDKEFNDTPGSDPSGFYEKWTSLSKPERDQGGFTLGAAMKDLGDNLKRQREIEANPSPTPAEQAELTRLQGEAEQLARDHHDALRDHVAGLAANNWYSRMMLGNHADFDTTGPSGKYLNARVLPPEADVIMRDFMHTETTDAIPNYIHAVSRKVAYAERFGANNEVLTQAKNALKDVPGIRAEDIDRFFRLIDTVTGRNNTQMGLMRDLQGVTNVVHALGSLALMPRAVWSAFAEPQNAALLTGNMRVGFKIFANQFGQLMRTASSMERTEFAQFLNVVTSAQHDSIMLSRMSADYSDSPRLNRLMTNYYRISGMTQVTNSQRIGAAAAGNWFIAKLARDYLNTGTGMKERHARDTATRWLNELGIHPDVHADFAKWMGDLGGNLPSLKTLQNDHMAGAYGLAIRTLTDRIIQDPYKVDRAMISNVPVLGLAYQLMSFNYQFQRNVLTPAWNNIEHSYGRARKEGYGRVPALLQAGGTAAHAMAMAGSMIGVGLVTTALRQYLFAPDQWDKHEKDGTLGEYLAGLAMQRSGLNGTIDPIIQVFTNLRYGADLSSLLDGASMNWITKNAQDVIQPFVTTNDSPNTNTRLFNATKGAFNLFMVPAAATGLTMLGAAGGPLTRLAAGAALQYGTSPGTAAGVAGALVGEKGAEPATKATGLPKLGATLPKLGVGLPKLGKPSEGGAGAEGGGGGFVPWGLVDDVALPAWRYVGPVINSLPSSVKYGALGVGAIYGGAKYLEAGEPFRGQKAPQPKQQQAR